MGAPTIADDIKSAPSFLPQPIMTSILVRYSGTQSALAEWPVETRVLPTLFACTSNLVCSNHGSAIRLLRDIGKQGLGPSRPAAARSGSRNKPPGKPESWSAGGRQMKQG